jgi:hypothetical protein
VSRWEGALDREKAQAALAGQAVKLPDAP